MQSYPGDVARKVIGYSPLARKVVRSRAIRRLLLAARGARLVQDGKRFFVREITGRPGPVVYRLRKSELRALIRHDTERDGLRIGGGTRDPEVLLEVFHRGDYEPPPAMNERLVQEKGLKILDVGANIGLFGLFAFDRFRVASLTALEPDPANAALLRSCIQVNRLEARWRLVQACASTREGRMSFLASGFADAHIAREPQSGAITVDAVDLFTFAEGVDILKIDIQGGEWDLLADERLATLDAKAIVMEWHADGSGAHDPRSSASDALKAAGYEVFHTTPGGHTGVLWAGRPAASR